MGDFESIVLPPYGEGISISTNDELISSDKFDKCETVLITDADKYKYSREKEFFIIWYSEKTNSRYCVLSRAERHVEESIICPICESECLRGVQVVIHIDYVIDVEAEASHICEQCYSDSLDWFNSVMEEKKEELAAELL